MRRLARYLSLSSACLVLGASASASDLTLDGQTLIQTPLGFTISSDITGEEGQLAVLLADLFPGPADFLGEFIPIGLTGFVQIVGVGVIPNGGAPLNIPVPIPDMAFLNGLPLYFVAAVVDEGDPTGFDFSNGASTTLLNVTGFTPTELAGRQLVRYPFFEFTRAFNAGTNVQLTVDPSVHPLIVGKTADVYVTAPRTAGEWDSDPTLVDVSGDGANTVQFAGPSIKENTFTIDAGTLNADAGPDLGVGYDVVIDLNQNGVLDKTDYIDGYSDEAGTYAVHDLTQPGPYAVTETLYSGGSFLGQNTFYPSNISSLGVLPLIVVSHGNGHNYQWYDHLGNHLASYGFVVMSHQNNTVPGIETSSTTTLTNTDWFLGNLASINGGVLQGHVDGNNIGWIGHSRGGEGVARAYDRLLDGAFVPANYGASDIQFISSIAPTDFLGVNDSDVDEANYHLWVGEADADVSGCVSSNVTQSYHLLDRAEQQRQSIALHGAGHGDFHNGGGSSVASGPCLIGRSATHGIMRGYALPLFKHHLEGNIPAKDFLWRQWESFKPLGAPTGGCIVVDLQYRDGDASGKFVIDDFQSNASTIVASTGEAVSFDLFDLSEGRFDDPDSNFTHSPTEPFNGYSQAGPGDTGAGIVFSWDSAMDYELAFDVPAAAQDVTAYEYLSFRAAQGPRHPLTTAQTADVFFGVELADGSGGSSLIIINAYGGGVEEPYQRTGCGSGTGWGAEFETVRIRLTDFAHDFAGVDLTDIETISFRFGPSFGTQQGRLGFDDLELTTD